MWFGPIVVCTKPEVADVSEILDVPNVTKSEVVAFVVAFVVVDSAEVDEDSDDDNVTDSEGGIDVSFGESGVYGGEAVSLSNVGSCSVKVLEGSTEEIPTVLLSNVVDEEVKNFPGLVASLWFTSVVIENDELISSAKVEEGIFWVDVFSSVPWVEVGVLVPDFRGVVESFVVGVSWLYLINVVDNVVGGVVDNFVDIPVELYTLYILSSFI